MNKKGTEKVFEHIPSWVIGLAVIIVVIIALVGGPKAAFAKMQDVWNEIIGENIVNPNNGGSVTISEEYKSSYVSLVNAFNEAKAGSRCFVNYKQMSADMKGNKIRIEEDKSVNGLRIVFINDKEQRILLDKAIIGNIKPCVLSGKGAETFYDYWLRGLNPKIEGFEQGNIEIYGDKFKINGKEYRINSMINSITGDNNIIYRSDSNNICLVPYSNSFEECSPFKGYALGQGCADILMNKVRLCSEPVEETSYDCKKEINGFPYFFKNGEYYCENPGGFEGWFKGDAIYECKNGNVWENKKIDSIYFGGGYRCITSLSSSKLPYNKGDECCCKPGESEKCIKKQGSFKSGCNQIGFEDKGCPANIGKRRVLAGG